MKLSENIERFDGQRAKATRVSRNSGFVRAARARVLPKSPECETHRREKERERGDYVGRTRGEALRFLVFASRGRNVISPIFPSKPAVKYAKIWPRTQLTHASSEKDILSGGTGHVCIGGEILRDRSHSLARDASTAGADVVPE